MPAARGLALFLSLFALLNIFGSCRTLGFDANVWWVDLRLLPNWIATAGLAAATVGLLGFAVGLPVPPIVRRCVAITAATLAVAVACDGLTFYRLWLGGRIHPGVPVPLSLFIGVALALIARSAIHPWRLTRPRQRTALIVAFAASTAAFPLAQMYCFGKTDYRRPADAVVVFGARAYADGTPSLVLADRTRTAVDLYRHGMASALIFSGGPGDGATSEPQAMRNVAITLGVPASAIILDEGGINTAATVAHTVDLFERHRFRTVLAVSHFYHLPRVKLAYVRRLAAERSSVQVLTVPAEETQPLPKMPWYVSREVLALWTYYLRPLLSPT